MTHKFYKEVNKQFMINDSKSCAVTFFKQLGVGIGVIITTTYFLLQLYHIFLSFLNVRAINYRSRGKFCYNFPPSLTIQKLKVVKNTMGKSEMIFFQHDSHCSIVAGQVNISFNLQSLRICYTDKIRKTNLNNRHCNKLTKAFLHVFLGSHELKKSIY